MSYRLGNYHYTGREGPQTRRAFHYAGDDSSSDLENMDEEEQEKLITKLKRENDDKNELWIRCLLGVTITSFLPFLPSCMKSKALQPRIMCLLSITSIFATAYMLVFVPTRKRSGHATNKGLALSPIHKYLPYLNGVLSLLIGLNGMSWKDRKGAHDGFWILTWLPTVIFAMVVAARHILVEVDPNELLDLKYDLKGA